MNLLKTYLSALFRSALLTLIILPLLVIAGCSMMSDGFHRQAIPAEIGIGRRVESQYQSGFRSGCGIVIYKLDRSTRNRIRKKGLDFFDSVNQARGHDEDRYRYQSWRETPRADWKRYEDYSYQLNCGGEIDDSLFDQVVAAGQSPGSYYTWTRYANIMIVPDERWVIYTYYD